MNGRIATFYSWKGGVGRTMALANVGVQLTRRGKRVLLVDWDLEAPGLELYFRETGYGIPSDISVRRPGDESGLLGLLADASDTRSKPVPAAWQERCATVTLPSTPHSASTTAAPGAPRSLHVLGSGFGTPEYSSRLQSFSWTHSSLKVMEAIGSKDSVSNGVVHTTSFLLTAVRASQTAEASAPCNCQISWCWSSLRMRSL